MPRAREGWVVGGTRAPTAEAHQQMRVGEEKHPKLDVSLVTNRHHEESEG